MKSELLDRARIVIQSHQKSFRTEQSYMDWIYRFILFHKKNGTAEYAESEISRFIEFLNSERKA